MTCLSLKTSPVFLTAQDAAARISSLSDKINRISDPTTRYTRAQLNGVMSGITTIIESLPSAILEVSYPNINDRVDAYGPITRPETAEFIEWGGYVIDDLLSTVNNEVDSIISNPTEYYPSEDISGILSQLDYYYNENFAQSISGGVCANIMGSVMQAIGFVSAIADAIDKLQNLDQLINDAIQRLMNWKQMLNKMIDELKAKIMAQVQQFFNKIASLASCSVEMMSRLQRKLKRVEEFLKEPSIDKVKSWVETTLAQIAGQFEKLNADAIAHILLVVCQLADSIIGFMRAPLEGFKSMINNCMAQKISLTDETTLRVNQSVAAGNRRFDPYFAKQVREAAIGGGGIKTTSLASFTDKERMVIASIMQTGSYAGEGISITHTATVMNDEEKDPINWGGYSKTAKLNPRLYVALYRIAVDMGKSFAVNSSFRGPDKNASVGGKDRSLHLKAGAIDVLQNGLTTNEKALFVMLASREGLGGIQYYPNQNFTHIDVGSKRHWCDDVGGSIPAPIKEAILNHAAGYAPRIGLEIDRRIFDDGYVGNAQ